MAKENLLLFNSFDQQYFVGDAKLAERTGIVDVTGIDAHIHDAAIFCGVLSKKPDMHDWPMQLEVLAKSGSEHGHQRAVISWLNYCAEWYPDFERAYAAANGGSRGDTELSRKIEGGKMKAEGVKRGVPDLFQPTPRFHTELNAMFAGLYVEMKDAQGGDGGSEEQHGYLAYLNGVGYAAQICNGYSEAIATWVKYFELKRRA